MHQSTTIVVEFSAYDLNGSASVLDRAVSLMFTLSSATNPVIYALYSDKFRGQMKAIAVWVARRQAR
jgi:hypothetical protein